MAQKITKVYKDLFGSAPYSGRSSSIKPPCSKTEIIIIIVIIISIINSDTLRGTLESKIVI